MLSIKNKRIFKLLALSKTRNLIISWSVINGLIITLIIFCLYHLFNQRNRLENYGRDISEEINYIAEYKSISLHLAHGNGLDINISGDVHNPFIERIRNSSSRIEAIQKNDPISNIHFRENMHALVTDYENLRKENELLLEYLMLLGNEEAGIYSKLYHSANDFRNKYRFASAEITSLTGFEKVFYSVQLLKNHKDEQLIFEIQEKINEIFDQLNTLNPDSSNYLIARVGDALGEVKLSFQDYARKLFEIGLSPDKGLSQKLTSRYTKIEYRLKDSLEIIYAKRTAQNLRTFGLLLFLILLLPVFNIRAFYFYSSRENRFLKMISEYFDALEKGNLYPFNRESLPEGFEPIVEYAEIFARKFVQANNAFARISQGNINLELKKTDHFSQFYTNFLILKQSIENLNVQVRQEKKQHEELVWIKTGIDRLTDVMRREYENPLLHANEIINMLVAYLNIPVGAIYLVKEENHAKYVEMASAFAYGKEKQLYKKLAFGEGIVGTAASERKTYNITNVPHNYFNIVSALGETKPKNVVVSPIKLGEEIYGVIELASLSKFKDEEVKFVEEVCKTVAYSFAISKVYIDTLTLFENSNLQIAELESENQLLMNDYNDLNKSYKELALKSTDNEFLVSRLNELAIRLLLDLDGNILAINPRFELIFRADKMKFIQTNYRDYLTNAKFVGELDFEYFWKEIRAGINLDMEFSLLIAGNEFWFKQYFYPVKDEMGRVKKIQVIGFDITDKIKLQQELSSIKNV